MQQFLINQQITKLHCDLGSFVKLPETFDFKAYSNIALLSNKSLAKIYQSEIESFFAQTGFALQVIELEDGEQFKDLKQVQKVWQKLFDLKFDRHSLLINFGGGMISDLGGFAAATFMRGIDFINVPTSLLAQADAALGGKTAINFGQIKNGIGLFVNPKLTVIDPTFTKSLPEREILSGFAEILKHAIIFDSKLFALLDSKPFLSFSLEELVKIIDRSCFLKMKTVEQDFLEKNQRKLLNFGHTLGHAFEAISLKSKKPLAHGEAVALGMLLESRLAVAIGLLSKKDYLQIEQIINRNYVFELNREIKVADVLALLQFDKKKKANEIYWSLPQAVGRAVYDQLIPESEAESVVNEFMLGNSKNVI